MQLKLKQTKHTIKIDTNSIDTKDADQIDTFDDTINSNALTRTLFGCSFIQKNFFNQNLFFKFLEKWFF